MNSTPQNISSSVTSTTLSAAEETLQLIARLPSPQGLEDRVISGLHSVPRAGRVLHWPRTMSTSGAWMRGAAAAAIVFVVAGGGWGIYTRVTPSQPGKVLVMPRGGVAGGFSGAGAMRTPDTLRGPTVAPPATASTNGAKAIKKKSARAIHVPLHAVQPAAQSLSTTQPKVSAAK